MCSGGTSDSSDTLTEPRRPTYACTCSIWKRSIFDWTWNWPGVAPRSWLRITALLRSATIGRAPTACAASTRSSTIASGTSNASISTDSPGWRAVEWWTITWARRAPRGSRIGRFPGERAGECREAKSAAKIAQAPCSGRPRLEAVRTVRYTPCRAARPARRAIPHLARRAPMADWDVIAKQRLTEDWAALRSAYLPLNQAMRRTVEFLERRDEGSFNDLLVVGRERLGGAFKTLEALTNRRSPWVRLEAIRNLRVLGTGIRGAASDDPLALLRYLFAFSELLTNVWKDAPSEARVATNLKLHGPLDFWFGCDCCAVGTLQVAGPDDPPDLLRGKDVRIVWEVDALFA